MRSRSGARSTRRDQPGDLCRISRRPMGQGEVSALPVAAGAEGPKPPIPTPPVTVPVTARATQRNRTRKFSSIRGAGARPARCLLEVNFGEGRPQASGGNRA